MGFILSFHLYIGSEDETQITRLVLPVSAFIVHQHLNFFYYKSFPHCIL